MTVRYLGVVIQMFHLVLPPRSVYPSDEVSLKIYIKKKKKTSHTLLPSSVPLDSLKKSSKIQMGCSGNIHFFIIIIYKNNCVQFYIIVFIYFLDSSDRINRVVKKHDVRKNDLLHYKCTFSCS